MVVGILLVLSLPMSVYAFFHLYLAALAYVVAIIIGLYAVYHILFGLKKEEEMTNYSYFIPNRE